MIETKEIIDIYNFYRNVKLKKKFEHNKEKTCTGENLL